MNITFKGLTDGATFGACVLTNGSVLSGLGVTISCAGQTDALTCNVAVGVCTDSSKEVHAAAAVTTAAAAVAVRAAVGAGVNVSRYMPNTNFPHGDIQGLDHEFAAGTNWTACQALCDSTAACHAWTFLKRGSGMACCIKGPVENDGCPAAAEKMVSGAKVAGSVSCNNPGPGPGPHPHPHPPKSSGVPLFGATEINVRITPGMYTIVCCC